MLTAQLQGQPSTGSCIDMPGQLDSEIIVSAGLSR